MNGQSLAVPAICNVPCAVADVLSVALDTVLEHCMLTILADLMKTMLRPMAAIQTECDLGHSNPVCYAFAQLC